MTGLFDGVVPFVTTARHLSFSKAAAELGVTAAAVSKAVRRLERELGVKLLHRTTRYVAVSDEGALFLARCEDAIAQVRTGRELLARAQRVPRGELTVSLPFVLGPLVVGQLERFTASYRALRVNLRFTDRKLRLVDDRVDVAVRVGPLPDSTLVSRKLASTRWATVASPAYLARRGTPTTVEGLREHACLRFKSPRGKVVRWSFEGIGEVDLAGIVDLDQGDFLVDAAVAGLGIAQVFDLMVATHLRAGRLVQLLPEHIAPGPAIYALCLSSQRSAPKVRAFVDFLVGAFAPKPAYA